MQTLLTRTNGAITPPEISVIFTMFDIYLDEFLKDREKGGSPTTYEELAAQFAALGEGPLVPEVPGHTGEPN